MLVRPQARRWESVMLQGGRGLWGSRRRHGKSAALLVSFGDVDAGVACRKAAKRSSFLVCQSISLCATATAQLNSLSYLQQTFYTPLLGIVPPVRSSLTPPK